ncbi:MAG: FmdB family zinc ribbon protein [Dehalococcoidia bacterium]
MPIYEYFCEPCDGVFELLRPARQASDPQPCPQCDEDARRIMPTEFQAFTLRKGLHRRLPDRGTYWHLNREVSTPVNAPAPPGEHPELRRKRLGPPKPPTAEERESFEQRITARLEQEAESVASGRPPVRDLEQEQQAKAFVRRVRVTAEDARLGKRRDPNAKTTARTRSGKHGKSSPPA